MDRLFRIDFYPADWLVKTGKMTLEQRGIYIQIVSMIYANCGAIENDPSWIGRASNCSPRLARSLINQLIEMDSIQVQGSKITQRRCEHELNMKRTHLELSAKGGRTKAENERVSLKFNDIDSTECEISVASPSPSPSPSPPCIDKAKALSNAETKKPKNLKQPTELENDFEKLWVSWKPFDMDKGSKLKAKQSYLKSRKEIDHEDIISGAGKYLEFCHCRQQRTAHLVTWLNQKRWADEYPAVIPAQSANTNNAAPKPTNYERALFAGIHG